MKTNRLILCVVAITVAGCGKNTSASSRRERRGRAHLGPSASRKPGAARGGIDEVNVPPHQFGKCRSDRRSAYSRKSYWSVNLFTLGRAAAAAQTGPGV